MATLKLGQARGIAMLVPASAGLPVAEYAQPGEEDHRRCNHCEKYGRMMIGVLLPKADPQSEDAADALAIAVACTSPPEGAMLKVADDDGKQMARGDVIAFRARFALLPG